MTLSRTSLAVIGMAVPLALPRPTSADPSPGLSDHDRALHAALIAAMGATYLVAEFPLGPTLSPTQCNWCDPPALDVAVRDAVVWHDKSLANTLGSVDGFLLAPIAAGSLVVAGGWGGGWRRAFDDVAPVAESAIAVSLLQHVTKVLVARQRPYAHFAPPGTLVASEEDNVSFWSGHTSLTFALAVSAGEVASIRGYAIAPVVWATGLTLAATTGYLRMAADYHYATDVLTGAAMGSLVGYLWPRLVKRYLWTGSATVTASVTPGMVALSGRF